MLLSGCGTPAPPSAEPSTAPTETPAPSPTTGSIACMDQMAWEPHEGEFSMHAFAASRALEPFDPQTGASESRTAAVALRAMADLAAGPNPRVAGLLRRAALDLDGAAAAFGAGDVARARQWLSDADAGHLAALSSTTADDWCRS